MRTAATLIMRVVRSTTRLFWPVPLLGRAARWASHAPVRCASTVRGGSGGFEAGEPTCMTALNGSASSGDATVGPPCRPAAAIGMMATWLSTIVAVG